MRQGLRQTLFVFLTLLLGISLGGLIADQLKANKVITSDTTAWFIVFGVLFIVIWILFLIAKKKLKNRFLLRPYRLLPEWLRIHYPRGDVFPQIVEEILQKIADGLGGGVQPEQILPMDSLKKDFQFCLFATEISEGIFWRILLFLVFFTEKIDIELFFRHPLKKLLKEFPEWFQKQYGRQWQFNPDWETVDDMLRGTTAQALAAGESEISP